MNATAKVDMSGLKEQVKRLALRSSRTLPQILDQVALNSVGRAVNETPQVLKGRIEHDLGQWVKESRVNKLGKSISKRVLYLRPGSDNEAPRLALIINARRAKAGKPGLYGKDMERAIAKTLRARLFSSGFEKSGWFTAIRKLAAAITAAGKKPFIIAQMKGIAAVGRPKGDASPASKSSFFPQVSVMNNAKEITRADRGALQRGIDAEAAEINRHIEEDLAEDVKKFNEEGKK